MNRRAITIAALAAAATVLVAGVVFSAVRDRRYESVATVAVSPSSAEPDRISSLLESFERSGTLGTYVELMASRDTTVEARELGVDITVRAVPDTRAIRIVAEGGQEDVVPALQSVIVNTQTRQTGLSDLFELEVLESPSAPVLAGPGTGILLLATLLLAVFAAVAVVVILRRFAPPPRRPVQSSGFRAVSTRPEP